MANLQTTVDLKAYVLDKSDELTDGSSDFDSQALEFLNRQYQAIWLGGQEIEPTIKEDWYWLWKHPPGVLNLEPAITTGTVAVTNNTTTITFSSAPAASVTGFFLRVTDERDVFRIGAHTAGATSAQLDAAYTGTTNAAASYTLMHLEYDLASDVLALINPLRTTRFNSNEDPHSIDGIDLNTLERDWPLSQLSQGVPEKYAVVAQTDSSTKIRFNRYGSRTAGDLIRVEYNYLQRPDLLTTNPDTTPLIPWEWRQTLADAAIFLLLVTKNDSRADTYGLSARNGLTAMAKENQYRRAQRTGEFGQIVTRPTQVHHNRVLRTETGLIIG